MEDIWRLHPQTAEAAEGCLISKDKNESLHKLLEHQSSMVVVDTEYLAMNKFSFSYEHSR